MSPAGRRRSASAPPYRGLSLPAHYGGVTPLPWRGRTGPRWALFFFGSRPARPLPAVRPGPEHHPVGRQRLGGTIRKSGPGAGGDRGAGARATAGSPARSPAAPGSRPGDPAPGVPEPPSVAPAAAGGAEPWPRSGNPSPVSKTPVDPAHAADNREVTVSVAGGEETRRGRVPEERRCTRRRRATGNRRPVRAPCLRPSGNETWRSSRARTGAADRCGVPETRASRSWRAPDAVFPCWPVRAFVSFGAAQVGRNRAAFPRAGGPRPARGPERI